MTNNDRKRFVIDDVVGDSAWCQYVRQRVKQIASSNRNVLIHGPIGTRKGLIARALHNQSPRKNQPFIPVNCAAVPNELFASQLFGHTKGAFKGAGYASLGCFRAADRGTIFLDEIGELCLENQAKLLRVLQEGVVTPVGGHTGVPVSARTVVATNRNLPDEIRSGRFRLDLFYRLNETNVTTQELSQRIEDMEHLAHHFLAKTAIDCGLELKTLSEESLELLRNYEWPGNVRELEQVIERAVVHCDKKEIPPAAFVDLTTNLARRFSNAGIARSQDNAPERKTFKKPSIGTSPLMSGEPWVTLSQLEFDY